MKISRVLLLVAILSWPLLVQAQQRGRLPGRQPARGTVAPPAPAKPEAAEPTPETRSGPGVAEPPAQGWVKSPEAPTPGTAAPFGIADPLGIAYWELYDRAKPVTITGKVTRVDWTNPNSYIYIDAVGGAWAVESSLIQFKQSNVSPAVRVGETITVAGYLPKDVPVCPIAPKIPRTVSSYLKDSHLIRAGEITTVFGQKLTLGKPPTAAETEERLKYFSLGC